MPIQSFGGKGAGAGEKGVALRETRRREGIWGRERVWGREGIWGRDKGGQLNLKEKKHR